MKPSIKTMTDRERLHRSRRYAIFTAVCSLVTIFASLLAIDWYKYLGIPLGIIGLLAASTFFLFAHSQLKKLNDRAE